MRERLNDGLPGELPDAPVEALLGECEALAKAWLIELLRGRSLAAAARLPVGAIAAGGPEVCAGALRALGDEGVLGAPPAAGLERRDAIGAAEALRRVLWAALLDELRAPSAEYVAVLADRLGYVIAAFAEAWAQSAEAGRRPELVVHRGDAARGDIRGALAQRLAGGGRPLALLLVEAVDLERLEAADIGGDATEALRQAEQALSKELRAGDELLREQLGRYWVIAPGTVRADAQRLAQACAAAPREQTRHRGAPLSYTVGVAACPDDGDEAQALVEHAEEALLAARAAGLDLLPI